MADPRAEQIAQAAVAALEKVRVAGGYYTDLGLNVSRRRWDVAQMNKTRLPCLSVWMGTWKKGQGRCIGQEFGTIRRVLQVDAWTVGAPEDVDADGIRAEADVMRAILGTGNFALSFVTLLEPLQGAGDPQDFGDRGIGFRPIAFTVEYKDAASGPAL